MNEQMELDFSYSECPDPKIPLVAFTGKARAGKDTASSLLIKKRGYTKIAFADPMKAMLKVLVVDFMGQDPRYLTDAYKNDPLPFFKEKNISVRYLMQTLGTEWGREIVDQDLWVNIAKHRIDSFSSPVVISDCRFDTEAQFIARQGGKIFKIERNRSYQFDHISEAGIKPEFISGIISNDGDFDDLKDQVFKAVED